MNSLDKIITILKSQKKKQKELTDYIGISNNTFTNWRSGQSKSYQKYLPKIAEFLNVPIDSLLDDEDTPDINHEQLVQDKINFLRAREFDNIEKMCWMLGIDEDTIKNPSQTTLSILCKYFNISLDYFNDDNAEYFRQRKEFDNLKIALYGDTSIDDSVINDVKEMAIKLYNMKNFQK